MQPHGLHPPAFSVHGISKARILKWVAISFSKDLPDPGTEPASPALAGRFFATEPPGKPLIYIRCRQKLCFHLYEVPEIVKFTESESTLVDARIQGLGRRGVGNENLVQWGQSFSLGR